MRDPHVVALIYRLVPEPHVQFQNSSAPVVWDTDLFQLRLVAGEARLEMKAHYALEDDARRDAQRYLRSWEINSALSRGVEVMHFDFERAEIIDRNPPPPALRKRLCCQDPYVLPDTLSPR